ncbi:MAG: MFS transporter [Verrucomicrobia bacterium]|nr:MFS transporter [Verrucomicrobiota bacterium]
MDEPNRTDLTYRYERRRAVTAGMIETAGHTFLLLIAVRGFEAGATAKALVAAGGSVGLLISPLVVTRVEALGVPTAQAAARLALLGASGFLGMALLPWLPAFVLGSILGTMCSSAAIPLLTQIYQDNYPEKIRGRLFSRTVMIRIAAAALFSELAGRLLGADMRNYRWLLLVFAAAFVFAAHCYSRIPSRPLRTVGGTHPFRALRFVREDPLFRHTLLCWMLMGFANLMMVPIRVEYLANPKYQLGLSIGQVALLTGVVPNLARLVMSPIWGLLFDRMNFFALRVTLNFGFAIGILTFFLSDQLPGLIAGAIIYGISTAGGDVAWGLWVTKFAPHDRVADYMSVHTFFTGVRGVLAPSVAFYLAGRLPLPTLGWISAGLIVVASVLLLPEIRTGRLARPATALVEEVSE